MNRDELLELIDSGNTCDLVRAAVKAHAARAFGPGDVPRSASVVFEFAGKHSPETLLVLFTSASGAPSIQLG